MKNRVLVAGAGGVLGRLIVRELGARGHFVRAVVRRARPFPWANGSEHDVRTLDALRPGAWSGVCDDIDVVVSALGASVDPSPLVGRRPYTRVDAPANLALIDEARRARVGRFVYVSLIDGAKSRSLDYAEGHERVVDGLRAASMSTVILRPTGFFCAMAALIEFARFGIVPVFGDGSARTNPIDERDLAEFAAAAVESVEPGLREIDIGGPEVFTRRRIAELAFESLGKRPRLMSVPTWAANAAAAAVGPINPRAAHFTRFAAYIMTHECLAPAVGLRGLEAFFREYAAGKSRKAGV